MAKGKETGAGLVTVDYGVQDPNVTSPGQTLLFHNFNFDGDEVKPGHQEELDKRVVRQMIEKKQVVRIVGHASKQGDANYNMELSRRRAMAVRAYLIKKGVPQSLLPLDELKARGEADSTSRFEDDELDRGVTVEFLPDYKPKPKPPKPKFDPPPPEPIIKPPFPLPLPVPSQVTQKIVLREVFINHTLISHDPGEFKGDRQVDGWRLIPYLTVYGQAPVPFLKELDHRQESSRFFMSPVQFITAQREEFDCVAYFYKYDPNPTPVEALPFELPVYYDPCEGYYNSGIPVNSLPRIN